MSADHNASNIAAKSSPDAVTSLLAIRLSRSEDQFHAKLHLARRAHGGPDGAEIGIAKIRIRQSVRRMIRDVDDLPTELQPSRTSEAELSRETCIDIEIASDDALGSGMAKSQQSRAQPERAR